MALASPPSVVELRIKNFLLIRAQNGIKSSGRLHALVHAGGHHGHVLGVQGAHPVQPFWGGQLALVGRCRCHRRVNRWFAAFDEACPVGFLCRRDLQLALERRQLLGPVCLHLGGVAMPHGVALVCRHGRPWVGGRLGHAVACQRAEGGGEDDAVKSLEARVHGGFLVKFGLPADPGVGFWVSARS